VTSEQRLAHIDRQISDEDVFEHVIKGIRLSVVLALVKKFTEPPSVPRPKEFTRRSD